MNERQEIAAIRTAAEMSEQNMKWYSYILDSIHSDDVDVSVLSDKMKIEFAFKMFHEEMVKNVSILVVLDDALVLEKQRLY